MNLIETIIWLLLSFFPSLLLPFPRDFQMTTHKEEQVQMQVLTQAGDAAAVLYDPGAWMVCIQHTACMHGSFI